MRLEQLEETARELGYKSTYDQAVTLIRQDGQFVCDCKIGDTVTVNLHDKNG
jgi:hypothetical protein